MPKVSCDDMKPETDGEREERLKEFWADQVAMSKSLPSLDTTLKEAVDYVMEKQASDPMVHPGLCTTYDKVAKGGGGCLLM